MQRPFKILYRVSWVDTDAGQTVHFSNFFRFFQRAEEEFYWQNGFFDLLRDKGITLPRVEAFCQYKKPAKFGDLLEIELLVDEIKEKAVKYIFKIFNKGSADLLASGHVIVVAVDVQTWRAVSIPKEIVEKLKASS